LAHIQPIILDSNVYKNGRYILSSESLWFSDILKCLKLEEKALGKKIKTRILGPFTLKVGKLINPEIDHIMPFVDQPLKIDGTQA
jgi:hypothetical protein